MIFGMMKTYNGPEAINVMRAMTRALLIGALAAVLSAPADAHAQSTATGVPNAMQGFSQNRDKPIQIDAASLEMRDKDKAATFSGNVKVVQGDTPMLARRWLYSTIATSLLAAKKTRHEIRDAPDRAAVRRSRGLRRKAALSSPRRIRRSRAIRASSICAPTPSRCTGMCC